MGKNPACRDYIHFIHLAPKKNIILKCMAGSLYCAGNIGNDLYWASIFIEHCQLERD